MSTNESEDDRLLSAAQTPIGANNHLRGFYIYSAAIEVYAVVALTLFLPVALEQYARDAGFLASDHSAPCLEATAVCEVRLLGVWTNTASFSLYTYSISVALQAVTVIAISGEANDPARRHRYLLLFTLLGGISCLMFLLVPPASTVWLLAPILAMVGNIAFGCAMVCLNTYVPLLAKQSIVESHEDEVEQTRSSQESKAASSISARGISAGYAAGITLLLLMLVPVTVLNGSLWSLRVALAATGAWWLLVSIPAFIWLPKPTATSNTLSAANGGWSKPWTELVQVLKEYRKIPETFKYLLAWFIMSDAFSTITSTAVLFAKTTLGMPASSLVFVGVLTPIFGVIGALGWPWAQANVLGTTNLTTLRIIVGLAVLIPFYGLVALRSSWELLSLCCYFGLLYGALQSYSRAIFGRLIPPNEEARFFALYSITDKSSSFIGPALVAMIADRTGSIRSGFVFLALALLLPQPVLARIDIENGESAAAGYSAANRTRTLLALQT